MAFKFNFTSNRGKIESDLETAIHDALDLIGYTMEADVVNEMVNWKPNDIIDTGNLMNSITHQVPDNYTVVVGTNVPYAVYVHYGTGLYAENGKGRKTPWVYTDRHGVKHWTRGVHPRPFLRQGIQKNIKTYQMAMANYLKKAMGGGGEPTFEDLLA